MRLTSLMLKLSVSMLVAMMLSSVVDAKKKKRRWKKHRHHKKIGQAEGSGGDVVLPLDMTQLFADVNNNNAVGQLLQARVPSYATSTRGIIQIAPGAFMANNYAMGNSLWIVTPQDTIVVFDTPESTEAAILMRNDMRREPAIGNKTITHIVYTIFQGDHTFGTRAFIEDPANNGQVPVIIGHKNLIQQAELFDTFKFIKMNRVIRVFGSLLPPSVVINAFTPLSLGATQYLEFYPTYLLNLTNTGDAEDFNIDGLQFKIIFIPGYTTDQLAVWFPATKLMHAADIFYTLMANIYTIRGEPARDAMAWSNTARIIQSYNAEVLYPSHSHVIYGRDNISKALENVADAIQYIHDQTVRLMGKGYTPDVISTMIQLPATLASEPFLLEGYGKIEGHSKAVADYYTGWFSGEAEDLLPVSKTDLAANMVRDFGRDTLIQLARKAYDSGNYRWALTLSSYVWRNENKPKNDALYWRTQSMKRLAESITSIQWRQYLYSEAMINWGFFANPQYFYATIIRSRPNYLILHTIENCLTLLSVHVNAQLAAGVNQTFDLVTTNDTNLQQGQAYRLRLLNSVLYFKKVDNIDPLQPTTLQYPVVLTDNLTWRSILSGKLTVALSVSQLKLSVVGGSTTDLEAFLGRFDFIDQF
jgi:alkyl sulfatase BDS1-like metallo-beta-lactamase superfamily hydrolase